MIEKFKNFIFGGLIVLFCLNILAWIAVYDLSQPEFLEVNFFDVGQGEAIFIETPQKHQILIDGGPSSVILEKLAKEMPFWDRTIDLIILTHPERDHLIGLIEVLKRYKIDYIFWTGVVRNTFEWKEWQKLIELKRKKGTKVFIAQINQKIKLQGLDRCNNLHSFDLCIFMEVLYPFENLENQIFKDSSNNTSIVTKLVYGQNSFLFTGDIYKSQEQELIIRLNSLLDSNVLKVAHHGSKTSSFAEFIEKVSPEIAVIQAGKNNPYGHPHEEVLDILQKHNVTVLRTDQKGDIKIISNGENLTVIN